MKNSKKEAFQSSLDLTSDELEGYIPELLQGLWELGSMPEYIIELIDRNGLGENKHIIDLGCGKGAVLVKLAKQFDISAVGVDLVPEFIEEANRYAEAGGVADKVTFKTEDIQDTLKACAKQDILIYGYDSEVLGDLTDTLKELTKCIKADGYIMLEFMFAAQVAEGLVDEDGMKNSIEQSGLRILDRIDWDKDALKQSNVRNTEIITANVERLIFQNPDKEAIFREYLENQIDECEEMEKDYICTTLLLSQLQT